MKQEFIAPTYQLISFLLRYPTDEHMLAMEEIEAFIHEIETGSVSRSLTDFLHSITDWNKEQWVEHYIEVFDFGKTSNLYMTYLKLGEQKERGLELLRLKNYYQTAGFEVTDKELPDYLPVMLEFCSQVSKEIRCDLLEKYTLAIVETKEKLAEFNSHYAKVLEALLGVMKEEGMQVEEVGKMYQEQPLSLEDARIMQTMRDQLIRNQLG
ncbi:nitrate reductase molybdenum cofactor assembly chaperone [Gracilibacillus oryzae]|uniref:Nitrate reductase molybdenum cofactor assembly chaperone n=1 Tax=Gracilibacillus oryzae TaxID=1672701 RepID=A0A7C8GVN9_9BACI|nr:nitrate reductase molybdenum cofactor assembly chaperone [Gracilibacillus oryzae]KAB8139446.1 nitrate reductase molybdenum cofactor assembly chaperone [Gracilibacillus oryzae]